MAWNVIPGRGLGPLCFGMSPQQVRDLPMMGNTAHVYRGRQGQMMEYRGMSVPVCEYQGGTLSTIVAGRHVPGVTLGPVGLFTWDPRAVVEHLEMRFGKASLAQEQLVFEEAGLRLGGFYDAHDHAFFAPGSDYRDERFVTLASVEATAAGTEDEREAVSFV